MATYSLLSDDEKNQIKISTKRDLEYQMYTLEVQVIAENAKSEPDAERLALLASQIAEKQTQIAAVN